MSLYFILTILVLTVLIFQYKTTENFYVSEAYNHPVSFPPIHPKTSTDMHYYLDYEIDNKINNFPIVVADDLIEGVGNNITSSHIFSDCSAPQNNNICTLKR